MVFGNGGNYFEENQCHARDVGSSSIPDNLIKAKLFKNHSGENQPTNAIAMIKTELSPSTSNNESLQFVLNDGHRNCHSNEEKEKSMRRTIMTNENCNNAFMKNAIDILGECELFSPLIAIHSSECAQQTAAKNGFDFGQMLLPYTTVQINIKEPIGQQQIKHTLHLDIRELKRSGFLLSNTVFRFVLQESILTEKKDGEQQSLLLSTFYQSFLHWHEPAEHEFLRAYLACIFVVSTADTDPLNKLAELEAEQHWEQHGQPSNSTTTAKRISPAYCVPSKWFFPNILKYFVLVHDNSLAELDPQRPNEIFPAICSKYGHNICHLVHLNSANPANPADEGMPDPWEALISKNERGLESGINLAKQSIYSGNKLLKHGSESQNNLNILTHPPAAQLPPVSSAPSLSPPIEAQPQPLLFTTSTAFNPPSASTFYHPLPATGGSQQIPPIIHSSMPPPPIPPSPSLTYAQIASGSNPFNSLSTNFDEKGEDGRPRSFGKWLSAEDRQRLRQMVEDFVRGALVPFVEKQIAEQSEILMKRGSLAKSTFTSMRKWLQNAATNATTTIGGIQAQQQGGQSTAIGAESAESQSRRLADLAFLFGLYQYSNQIYQSLKKDFANDQAWLYHAGCLEMASISAFFSNWQQFADQIGSNPLAKASIMATLRKQYPQRYMDNAIHFYANVCKQPLLALRALMNGVLILAHLEQFTEAAQQLIRFNTSNELALADLIEAVLLEHAARLFAQAGNRKRKTTFYLATAGTRMLKFVTQQQNQQEMSTDSLRHCRRLSRRFYEEVLNSKLLSDKGWSWAEHYLICQYISCI